MKKLFVSIAALVIATSAFANANDPLVFQRDPTDGFDVKYDLPQPASGAHGIFVFNGSTKLIEVPAFGSGFTLSSGVLSVTAAFSGLTGLPSTLAGYGIADAYPLTGNPSGFVTASALSPYLTIAAAASTYATTPSLTAGLAGKFNTPSGTTSQYVRGDGSLATLPGATARSFSTPSRALSTCFQISATRDALVSYAVDVTTTVTLGGTPEGAVFLRTYTNSGCSTGQVGIVSGSNGQPTTLTVAVGQQVKGSVNLYGMVPAGTWVRIETSNVSGTPTFAIRSDQQEVLF